MRRIYLLMALGLVVGAAAASCVIEAAVFCKVAGDCPPDAPFCDTSVNQCFRGLDGGTNDLPPGGCRQNGQCPSTMPICETGGACGPCGANDDPVCAARGDGNNHCVVSLGRCGECRTNTDCPSDKSICDATSYTCRPCVNADCASGVCNKSAGSCVDPSQVITVDNTVCPAAMGLNGHYCKVQGGISAANTKSAQYVLILGSSNIYSENVTINAPITIIGPYSDAPPSTNSGVVPATLSAFSSGAPVVSVTASSGTVVVDGIVIQGGLATGGNGVSFNGAGGLTILRSVVTNNADVGIVTGTSAAGVLTIDQSIIGRNGSTPGNVAGGIKISDVNSVITNSFIVGNGTTSSGVAGITYLFSNTHSVLFANNTVADNNGGASSFGVNCANASSTMITLDNDLFSKNMAAGTVVAGNNPTCTTASFACTDDPTAGAETNNVPLGGIHPAAGFVSATDYHLASGSPCIGKGNATNAPAYDIDGDPRGTQIDIGADQFKSN